MVMKAKPIDLKQSYVPGDPNAFPNNLEFTRSEDDPRPPIPPIVPFEGYNFLPTDYGYRSYFGLNALLDVPVLPSRCDKILTLRASDDSVILVALCEDGIWTKDPSVSSGAWVQQVTFVLVNSMPVVVTVDGTGSTTETATVTFTSLQIGQTVTVAGHTYTATAVSTAADVAIALSGGASPNGALTGALVGWTTNLDSPGVITYTSTTANTNVTNIAVSVTSPFATSYTPTIHRLWTDVAIGNDNYLYQRGRDTIWKLDDMFAFTTIAPSFITMSSQVGIFQAGGRIGAWDTANAVANSALSDFSDWTPSLETLANIQSFRAVKGNIITILKHGDGFVIYSTGSITSVQLDLKASGLLWEAIPVSKTKGIRHAQEVSVGITNLEHYIYTTEGLIVLKNFNAFTRQHEINNSLTNVVDFLREDSDIVTLKVMQGRYVFLQLVNPNYINGIQSTFETDAITVGAVEVEYADGTKVIYADGTNVFFSGSVSVPSAVFSIPGGQNIPIYPTYKGALVWDIILEKWGKIKANHQLLLELSPGNTLDEVAGFTTYGMNVGVLDAAGTIRIFDNNPTDSMCRWGKIGYKRQGMTQLLEVNLDFRSASTGTLEIHSSLNGRDFNELFSLSTTFNETRFVRHTSDFSCRWHTITLRGKWDLQSMSIAAKIAGRR